MITNQGVFKGLTIPNEKLNSIAFFSDEYYQIYYLIGKLLKPNNILEVGTELGYSLIALWKGAKTASYILSCDNETAIESSQTIAKNNLFNCGYEGKADFLNLSSVDEEFKKIASRQKFDLIHYDAEHSLEATFRDLRLCLGFLNDNGALLVHDYHFGRIRHAVEVMMGYDPIEVLEIKMLYGLAILQICKEDRIAPV